MPTTDSDGCAAEIWTDAFSVRVGMTVIKIKRYRMSGLGGERDKDQWRVEPPNIGDQVGEERWFRDHVTAQQFAGRLAELLEAQRSAWADAMQEIRREWLWHLAPQTDSPPKAVTDAR